MEIKVFKSSVQDWLDALKPSTAKPYLYGMYRFCEYIKLNPSELINQARQDYIDRVPPWEVRSVKNVKNFIQYLKKEDIANMTKISYINGVRSFYRFHEVPLPEIKNEIPFEVTEECGSIKLLKIGDIRKAVKSCGIDDLMKKALILTFLSSGQAQAEIHKLKGKDLKDIRNGVAVVRMTRGKTHIRYFSLSEKKP